MKNFVARLLVFSIVLCVASTAHASVDSYRFAHVTIATPWYIFVFLLMGIFAPFILMAVLAWLNAARKSEQEETDADHKPSVK